MSSTSFFPPLKLELETIPHIIIESFFTRENCISTDIWDFFYGFPSCLLASLFLFSLLFLSTLYKMKGIRAEMRDHSPYLTLSSMTIISVQPRALTKDKSFCVTLRTLSTEQLTNTTSSWEGTHITTLYCLLNMVLYYINCEPCWKVVSHRLKLNRKARACIVFSI